MSNPAAREKIDAVFTQWRSETDSVPQDERLRELLVGLLESEEQTTEPVTVETLVHDAYVEGSRETMRDIFVTDRRDQTSPHQRWLESKARKRCGKFVGENPQ